MAKLKALFDTYTLESSHGSGDDDHEGGSSNDDESRPAPPTPHQLAQELIFRVLDEQLAKIDSSAKGQAMVDGKDLVNALPNAVMNKIAEYPNVTVFFTYNYNGAKYTTAIPGAAIDTTVEWYGLLYMMNVFPTMQNTAGGAVPYIPGA